MRFLAPVALTTLLLSLPLFATLSATLSGRAVAAPAAGGAFPFPVKEKTLPNGLKIYIVGFDSPGLVAYYSVVRTGSRNEVEAGKSGFAHFFEHLMFRGSQNYSQDKYTAVIKEMGAD